MKRLVSIDFLRGVVILLMTLDHVRDMFSTVPIGDHLGTDLPVSYYITRWITHLCAPTFVFLAGLSIMLKQYQYHPARGDLQLFIIKRGLFLMFILTIMVSFLWSTILRNDIFTIYCAELWAIGWGMLFVALMLYFKPPVILLVSAALIVFHNLLDGFDSIDSFFWSMLHVKKELPLIANHINIIFFYPILPWCGIAGLGYSLGYYVFRNQLLTSTVNLSATSQQQKSPRVMLLSIAFLTLLVFLILRYSNFYGDPQLFTVFPGNTSKTLLSFFDVTKYPPSLLYTLIMIGILLMVLAFDDSQFFQKPNFFVTLVAQYGQSALIYYVLHLFLITFYAYILANLFNHGKLFSSGHLGITYLITGMVIITLYPVICGFKTFRDRYKDKLPLLAYF